MDPLDHFYIHKLISNPANIHIYILWSLNLENALKSAVFFFGGTETWLSFAKIESNKTS